MRDPETDSDPTLYSPEGVPLELPIAGPGSRIVAYALDWVLLGLLTLLLAIAFVGIAETIFEGFTKWGEELDQTMEGMAEGEGSDSAALIALMPLLAIALLAAYSAEIVYFLFWEHFGGASPGKRLLGLRVIGDDGRPLQFRASLVRNLFRVVDMLPSFYGLGLITLAFSNPTKRLGDFAAGTVVVRSRVPQRAAPIEVEEGVEALTLSRQALERLGSQEIELLRATIRRAPTMEAGRRQHLLRTTARALNHRLSPESDLPEDLWRHLQALHLAVEHAIRQLY